MRLRYRPLTCTSRVSTTRGATGFVLEGGDISMKRKTGAGKGAAAAVSDGRDTACLEPGESSTSVCSFKREVRKCRALCVRNNFTTLECATLSGSADAVKVYVAKKPRGTQVVTDVGFRLARIGLGGADMLMQTVHVVNRGSVAVEVAKPYVGAFACGGDGSVGGYTVQPCKPFTLPPGGSKQLTVACFTDKAAQAAKYARGVAGVWTALTMEVSSPDGVKTTLVANLHASDGIVTGAYAAGEMARSGPRSLIAWLATICSGGAACWLFYANRAALQGAYERRKKAAAAAATAGGGCGGCRSRGCRDQRQKGEEARVQDIGSPASPGATKGKSQVSDRLSSMDTESSLGSTRKTESVPKPRAENLRLGLRLRFSSRRYPPRSPRQNSETRRSRRIRSLTRRRQRWRRRRRPRARASPRLRLPRREKANGTDSKIKSVPAPEPPRRRRAPMARCLPRRPSRRRRHRQLVQAAGGKDVRQGQGDTQTQGARLPTRSQPKQQQERLREEHPRRRAPRPERLPTPNVTFAGKPIRTKASFG